MDYESESEEEEVNEQVPQQANQQKKKGGIFSLFKSVRFITAVRPFY